MPNVPDDQSPGAPGSRTPYVQPPNPLDVPPHVPPAPQGLKHAANVLGVIALVLFLSGYLAAAHHDATGGASDGLKGALYFGGFLCLIAFGVFHAIHAARARVS